MAAINKMEVTSLLLTETIIARTQALLSQVSLFGCLISEKSFARAKKTEFEKKRYKPLDQCLDFYIETSTRT
jgi:hypothetical protein